MSTAAPRGLLSTETGEAIWSGRLTWLRRWLAVSWLALLAATWRLWTPQVVFPQIPFFAALRTVPGWVDWVALGALVVGLFGLLVVPGASEWSQRVLRASALLAVASTTLLALLNQHRFQPWAYQFVIVAIVLAFTPAASAASLLRVLTVGIYFWSAVSKLDYTFLHTMGPQLLGGLTRALQLNPRAISPGAATFLAWAFPLDELAVAVLLAIRRTRTIGLVLSIVMHVLLFAALGPLGLDHSLGVLLWNAYFIGQNVLLFRRPAAGWRRTVGPGLWARLKEVGRGFVPATASAGIGHAAVFLAVWLPVLEPFGLLDHWPGWAVYAPAGERVTLLIGFGGLPHLPRELPDPELPREFRVHLERHRNAWQYLVRVDHWSLDALGAPLYPGARFAGGVALAIDERFAAPDRAFTLVVAGRADRFTGQRSPAPAYSDDLLRSVGTIHEYAESFPLNALPRKLGGW